MKLFFIIPVKDERGTLEALTEGILANTADHETTILFINDGSTDGTREVLDDLADNHDSVEVIHFDENQGKSAALLVGFEGAEVSRDVWSTEFVVERRTSDRSLEHDLEGGDDAVGFAEVPLPGFDGAWQLEIRNRVAREPGLGFRPPTGRALIANFAATPRCGAGKGRDCGRVVVGFDFHQDQNRFAVCSIDPRSRVGEETTALAAIDHGAVVRVGREHAIGGNCVGVANHLEQRALLDDAVEGVVGVENLVTAMLRVCLGKHHQFNIGRITAEFVETIQQIINFLCRESQSHFAIGLFQRFLRI